jgi:ERCC4-type nuclease
VDQAWPQRGSCIRKLEVCSYAISELVAVKRKSAQDFVAAIIELQRNLFRQMADQTKT